MDRTPNMPKWEQRYEDYLKTLPNDQNAHLTFDGWLAARLEEQEDVPTLQAAIRVLMPTASSDLQLIVKRLLEK